MNKISIFFSKWGFVIVLCIFGLGLLFALGCSIYTAVAGNLAIGIIGIVFNALCIAIDIGWICVEIKNGE